MKTILIVVSIVCFVLAALGVVLGTFSLGWLGLAFLAGSFITPNNLS